MTTLDTLEVQRVAEFYRAAVHEPMHASYAAFVRETIEQFEDLLRQGFRFARAAAATYETLAAMLADIANKRLVVYTGGTASVASYHMGYLETDSRKPKAVRNTVLKIQDSKGKNRP